MNNKLLTIRKAARVTCAWVPTGDIRTPLACVWVDADASPNTPTATFAANDESGGDRLCA
jgi:hypothetical protein